MSRVETPAGAVRAYHRLPRWQLAVSAVLVLWLGAQFVAGWKFANSQTYPIVGAAMFAGPPTAHSADFFVPRVFGVTGTGSQIEMDHHTFDLEPFEWRHWLKLELEDASKQEADAFGAELAVAYEAETGRALDRIELWRIPALTDDFGRGRLIRVVEL